MTNTIVLENPREQIKNGVDKLANIVKVTYGAKGQNVILGRPMMLPFVTKDGVTVAKEVMLDNDIENMGAYLVKQVATRTNDSVGDGTTTSTILAQAIVNEVHDKVNEGVNPIYLKRGIDKATEFAVTELKKLSNKITNNNSLKNIATISANGDKEIGNLIASVYKKIGKEGILKVEEGQSVDTYVEYTKGYEIDNGFLHWGFITNHDKLEVEMEDCHVLLYEGYIENPTDLNETLLAITDQETGVRNGLLIISDNIDTQILNTILTLKERGERIMAIKSPSYGSKRTEVMKDIASVIGAKVYSKETGNGLETVTLNGLGKVTKFITDANKTILVTDSEKPEVKNRIETVQNQLKVAKGKKDKDFTKERLAKLKGSFASINVGGYSEVEIREKIDRVEDALNATKSSLEEGYVAGGGVTYILISNALKELQLTNKDEQLGVDIVRGALLYPFKQILTNGGMERKAQDYINKINESPYGYGVNIDTEEFEDLFKTGVIDPTKVQRTALQNASSIASTFLTIGGIVWRDEGVFAEQKQM